MTDAQMERAKFRWDIVVFTLILREELNGAQSQNQTLPVH